MSEQSKDAWFEPKRVVGAVNGNTGLAANGVPNGNDGHPAIPRTSAAGECNGNGNGNVTGTEAMREKYPFLKLGEKPLVALTSEEAVRGLRRVMGEDGEVHGQGSSGYVASATIFNGAIQSAALAVVRPTSASHVSATIKFCRENGLDISVKAGGSGVHGQSIAGNVIIDMINMNQISICLPTDPSSLESTFERLSLSQRPSFNSHSSSSSTVKRSADDAGVPVGEEGGQSKRRDLDDIREDSDSPMGSASGSGSGAGRGSGSEQESVSAGRLTRSPMEDSGPNTPNNGVSTGAGPGAGDDQPFTWVNANATASRYGTTVDITRAVNDAFSYPASRNGSSSSSGLGARASGSASGSGSGSSNASGSGSGSGSASGSGSGSGSSGVRTTYINPSPTAVGSFPFVTTPHGSVSSYSSMPSSPYTTYPSSFSTHPFSSQSYSPNGTSISGASSDPPPFTYVTFGAGTHSKQLDNYTANSPYGPYHTPTSAFPVGAGQFLSGGFGFIGRKHGLAMDVLVEAEVVLADGRIVWVGEDSASGDWKEGEDPRELWWGFRGAGAALGVVTRFKAKAFYIPSVFAGNFIYIFDHTTPSLLRHVRDCIKSSPRSLYANIILTAGPPGAPAIVVVQLCFSGGRMEGERYVQAIAAWDGGRCLFQDFSERSFEMQQVAVEEVLKGGFGKKWYIKSDMLKSLTDHVIDETCSRFNAIPDGCSGGVSGDITNSCYPQAHRQGMFTVAALHQWSQDEPPALDTRCVTTAEEWINEIIRPNSTGGPLPCFLQSAQEADVRSVYGPNFERLLALKRQLDPTDLFKHAMFVRSDGSEGPDEWKQLPPLTESRVRAKNEERAKRAPESADDSSGQGGNGSPSQDQDKGKGKVGSPHHGRIAHVANGSVGREEGNNDGDAGASDGMEVDGVDAHSDSPTRTGRSSPTTKAQASGASSTITEGTAADQSVVAALTTPSHPSELHDGSQLQASNGSTGLSTSSLIDVESAVDAARREQSVQQRNENVPEGERAARGVVDPVTQGESQVM